jgi:preprotein translocase subunit SecB
MTEPGKLPTSGYTFDRVYANHQSLRVVSPSGELPPEQPALFGWEWRQLEGSHFEVTVQFGLDPSAHRPEEIRVTMNGRFAPVGEKQEVSLDTFVRYHAPAILMPFIREVVSGLTARGFFGALVLPPINVQSLMERQVASTTVTTRQLGEAKRAVANSSETEPDASE